MASMTRSKIKITRSTVSTDIVDLIHKYRATGVFVVVQNAKEQTRISQQLLKDKGWKPNEIVLIDSKTMPSLTKNNNMYPECKCVITTSAFSAGYSVSRFNAMIYQTLEKPHQQQSLIDRIVRLDQTAHVVYVIHVL
jgi:hypothetical protein